MRTKEKGLIGKIERIMHQEGQIYIIGMQDWEKIKKEAQNVIHNKA